MFPGRKGLIGDTRRLFDDRTYSHKKGVSPVSKNGLEAASLKGARVAPMRANRVADAAYSLDLAGDIDQLTRIFHAPERDTQLTKVRSPGCCGSHLLAASVISWDR